ncbi:hypothetical protein BDN72DRAFT_722969, partial [Pluteus cervinus]
MADDHTGGSLRIELLKGTNWMPWKRRMLAIFRELDLLKYIEDPEQMLMDAWDKGDGKARTRIELSIGDSEMVHILGATTARDMWKQLTTVKEARGGLGVIA